jgi:hypothetical protein
MGTRSLTHIKSEDGATLLTFYRQMDGYFSGHGKELAEFLAEFVVVNGIPVGDNRKLANGIGCLAAQILMHFKMESEVGGIYIYPVDSSDCGEEYVYTVSVENGNIQLTAQGVWDKDEYFSGSPEGFLSHLQTLNSKE